MTVIKIKENVLYRVRWVDARAFTEKTWHYSEDIAKLVEEIDLDVFESVGYLVGQTKHMLIFAAERCMRDEFTCYSAVFGTPRGCITEMRRVH
jgi:hypothetical protein